VNEVVPEPPARTVPPVAAEYQSMVVPGGLVADMSTVPVPHLEPLTGDVGDVGNGLIVAITGVRLGDIHPVEVFLAWA
jgi:putative intracellular protease/amidase